MNVCAIFIFRGVECNAWHITSGSITHNMMNITFSHVNFGYRAKFYYSMHITNRTLNKHVASASQPSTG